MGTAMMKSTMVIAAEKPLQKVARYSRPSTSSEEEAEDVLRKGEQQAQHRALGIELVRTKRTQNAQAHIFLAADTVFFTVFSPV